MTSINSKIPIVSNTELVDLEEIIILPQMRKTFTDIMPLTQNIRQNGIIHAPGIFAATPAEAEIYLAYNNKIHGKHTLLKSFGNRRIYKFLLFGERRTRALKILKKKKLLASVYPGTRGKVRMSTYRQLSIQQATAIQASENTPQLVNRAEIAEFHRNWYETEKECKGGKLSVRKFSEMSLKSAHAISRMLKFHMLPYGVKRLVAKGKLGYGAACELARIYASETGTRNECKEWLTIMTAKKWNPKELRRKVSEFIEEKKNPKMVLFNESAKQKSAETMKALQHLMDKDSRIAFMEGKRVLTKILNMFEITKTDLNLSPFMRIELREIFRTEVRLFEKILPHLKKLAGFLEKKETEKAETLTTKIYKEMDKIDRYQKVPIPIQRA